MIQMETELPVADNTGARLAKCIKVLGQRKTVAGIGDIKALEEAGIPAVVFGKAIYEGRIDLKELAREYGIS